jgi:hypothetical protein
MDIRHEFEGNVIVSIERDELPLHQAAPDLLAVLEDIVQASDANDGDSLMNAVQAAQTIIAKAKGLV